MPPEELPYSVQLLSSAVDSLSASHAHFSGDRPAPPHPTPTAPWMNLQFDCHHGNSEFWHMKVGGSLPFWKVFPDCLKGQVWQLMSCGDTLPGMVQRTGMMLAT